MSEGRRNSHVDVPETAATTALALPSSRSSITGYGAPGFSSGFKAAGMLDSTRQGSHHHAGGRHILPTSRIRSSSPGAGMLTPDQIPEALSLTLALASRGALPPALSGDRRGSADSTSSQEKGLSRNKRKAGAMSTANWKENLTRHMTTWHSPMQNRCPFCKDNAMRPSFNRLDNFKEHILRHFRDRNNCRARTGFDPAAEEFYLGITEMVKQRRQQQQHQQHMGMSTTAAQRKRLADHMNAAESPGSTDTCDTGSDAASDVDGDVGMMG
ncbi:unnamed protein product [Parascedosporium putredinis]|uniref:Uncharacterized protein n=1 Tax=Parascedosporium putredinis TaxID=1442378 RepID=A0A9P1HAR5_9PEZI|nr:unnamed protein product [Parascedosporium putredinis]CAI8001402.1 unnamed protein product [Parascedosporium putredinis]